MIWHEFGEAYSIRNYQSFVTMIQHISVLKLCHVSYHLDGLTKWFSGTCWSVYSCHWILLWVHQLWPTLNFKGNIYSYWKYHHNNMMFWNIWHSMPFKLSETGVAIGRHKSWSRLLKIISGHWMVVKPLGERDLGLMAFLILRGFLCQATHYLEQWSIDITTCMRIHLKCPFEWLYINITV